MPSSLVGSTVYEIWDFLDHRGKNEIVEWVRRDRLTVTDRARLTQKRRRLAQIDFSLAINTSLLAGPIHEHIYKLVIHADVMLRPMLCRGPINNNGEYTFLLGAVETGGKLPAGSKEKAAEHRSIVLGTPNRRCPHADKL